MDAAQIKDLRFRAVKSAELETILNLYHTVIGTEGCVWNKDYPGTFELSEDSANGNLFCMEYKGIIVGAASIVTNNELDNISGWKFRDKMAEIARVVILPAFQGRGIARALLLELFRVIYSRGFLGIHLLAAKENSRAAHLYDSLGFTICGSEHCYGNAYFCRELRFEDRDEILCM